MNRDSEFDDLRRLRGSEVKGIPEALPSTEITRKEAAVDFVLTMGRALHSYGASSPRLEDALVKLAKTLGLQESHFLSTPTAIMAAFGPTRDAHTALVRVEPGENDLGKLAWVNDVANEVVAGTLKPRDALARIQAIVDAPPRYGAFVTILSFGLSSAASAVFFGGGYPEVAVALAIGTVVGVLSSVAGRSVDTARIVEPVAAAFAAFASAVVASRVNGFSPFVTTLAGVVTLLPGLGLTTAMVELASRHLASGTARFAGAAVTLIGLGFGLALGSRLGATWLPPARATGETVTWPFPAIAVAVLVAALSFAVQLRVRKREIGWAVASGVIAFSGARVGAHLIGPEIGAFGGAFSVALASNAYARAFDRPATVVQVPGILLLVPGSVGFRGVIAMLDNDVVSGVTAAFKMVLIATCLVAGLLFANVALPSRRAL